MTSASPGLPFGTTLRSLLLVALLAVLAGCKTTGHDGASPSRRVGQEGQEFDEFDEFDEFMEFDEFGEEAGTQAEPAYDPLGGFNRAMFGFNDWLFRWVWNPAAKGVRYVVPQPARVAVNRFFNNLGAPVRFVNSLLQAKFSKAGTEFGRFAVNTTVGIVGFFDPADGYLGWTAPSPEDFGQTLATYGVGSGFPLTLPFLGPSNLRDGISLFPDGFLSPIYYVDSMPLSLGLWTTDQLNFTSLHIGEYESLKADALDPYTLFRDAFEQNRKRKIEE